MDAAVHLFLALIDWAELDAPTPPLPVAPPISASRNSESTMLLMQSFA